MTVLGVLGRVLALAAGAVGGGIYPDGHWDLCTQVTAENANDFVKATVDSGKTLIVRTIASEGWGWWVKQAPAWNAVTQLFKGHPDVAFGDVSLSKSRVSEIHGVAQNPGAGGWPTIRIFNNKTGYGGKAYDKKTSEAMCDELGPNNEYMRKLVEEYAPLNCNIDDTIGCSKKAKKFIEKWADEPLEGIQKQLLYLETASEPKKKSAKEWQQQRVDIFKQYARRHGAEL